MASALKEAKLADMAQSSEIDPDYRRVTEWAAKRFNTILQERKRQHKEKIPISNFVAGEPELKKLFAEVTASAAALYELPNPDNSSESLREAVFGHFRGEDPFISILKRFGFSPDDIGMNKLKNV